MGIQHRENGGGRCMNCENYCSRRESGDRDLFDTSNSLKGSDSPHEVTQGDMATPVDKEDAPAASPPPPVAPISAAPAENASTAPKQALARAKTGRAPMVEIKKKTKTKAIEGEHLNAFDFKKMYEEVQARRITVNFEMDGKEINEEKDLFQAAKEKDKEKRDKWVKLLLDEYQDKHPGDAAVLDDNNHPADHYAMKHYPGDYEPKEGDAAKLLQEAVGKHIVGFANEGKFEHLMNILGSYMKSHPETVVRYAKTKDPHGWTIVHLLARDRSGEAAKGLKTLLSQENTLANVKDDYLGFTALHHAIANHSLNGVNACLKYKSRHSLYIQEDLEDGDALILAEEYGTRIGEKFKSAAQFKDGQCEAQHEKDGKEILELVKKEYNIDDRIAYRNLPEEIRKKIGEGVPSEQL